jgi:hypothetical protein
MSYRLSRLLERSMTLQLLNTLPSSLGLFEPLYRKTMHSPSPRLTRSCRRVCVSAPASPSRFTTWTRKSQCRMMVDTDTQFAIGIITIHPLAHSMSIHLCPVRRLPLGNRIAIRTRVGPGLCEPDCSISPSFYLNHARAGIRRIPAMGGTTFRP